MGLFIRAAVGVAGLLFAISFVVLEALGKGPWRSRGGGRHERPVGASYWRRPTSEQVQNGSSTVWTWGASTGGLFVLGVAGLISGSWEGVFFAVGLFAAGAAAGFITWRFLVNESQSFVPRWAFRSRRR